MRQLVLGSAGRRISWTLITALLLPLLVLAGTPRQSRAQGTVTRLPQVAVLDFGVQRGVQANSILGRQATDAVVVEMTRTGRFDVTSRTVLNQQLQDLGLTLPLDNNGIQKLGQALGVDFVATGDITNVAFVEGPRRARVTVSVRLTDTVSGELANGAIQTGVSPLSAPGSQPDDDTLISQAISNAAFNAVKTVNNYTLPVATVLEPRDNTEVTINRGSRDGITQGLEMIVLRGSERVGKIRVTTVDSTFSIATITDTGKGIRPEDRARAIFALPGYSVGPNGEINNSPIKEVSSYSPQEHKGKSILGVILGIAAAVILASILFSKKSSAQTAGIDSGSLVAQAYEDASVIGTNDPSGARVQVRWETSQDVQNVIEFHIYRDNQIIASVSPSSRQFTDSAQLTGTFNYSTISYAGTGNNGANLSGSNNGGTTTNNGGGNNGGGNNGGGNNGGGNNGGGNSNSNGSTIDQPTSLQTNSATATGLSSGVTHRYQVTVLFRQVTATIASSSNNNGGGNNGGTGGNNGGTGGTGGGTGGTGTTGGNGGGNNNGTSNNGGGGGTNNGGQTILYRESSLGSSTGPATPLVRPSVNSVDQSDPARRVRVNYQTVQGGDQYILEFADSPSFSNKKSRGPFYTSNSAGGAATSDLYDITGDFNSQYSNVGRIYVRVGARSSTDSPGPLARDTPNGSNYIYSPYTSFTVQGGPPAAPKSVTVPKHKIVVR